MIQVIEVGPRDGLQNEKGVIPTDIKIAFVNALSLCGLHEIEVTAFVSPQWVPQLADAHEVLSQIKRLPGICYTALVPNEQGLDRALAADVGKICVFTAASDGFNRKNVNTTIDGTFKRMAPVVARATEAGLPVRGYISTAFWCPYEGPIDAARAVAVARRLMDMGVTEISVGDTIGKATPHEVETLLDQLILHVPKDHIAMHFHDTYGRAADNVLQAWRLGVQRFDASVGGLGGCPYAPGAPGNVATETVVRALRAHGAQVDVDLDKMAQARALIAPYVGRLVLP